MINKITEQLEIIYEKSEAKAIARALMSHVTGKNLTQLLTNPQLSLTENQLRDINEIIARLTEGEPMQYILKSTEFCTHHFLTDNRALIPRPETEELVEWIIDEYGKDSKLNILDIGTGSGCIAISLALAMPKSAVNAMDISLEAIQLTEENAELNKVQINLLNDNIFKAENSNTKYDIIVSNPPYIMRSEREDMEKNVTDYEPEMALFVPDTDPLQFYRAIALYANNNLNCGGKLFFEINQKFGKETCDLLSDMGYENIELRKDINNNDRMIRATKRK